MIFKFICQPTKLANNKIVRCKTLIINFRRTLCSVFAHEDCASENKLEVLCYSTIRLNSLILGPNKQQQWKQLIKYMLHYICHDLCIHEGYFEI